MSNIIIEALSELLDDTNKYISSDIEVINTSGTMHVFSTKIFDSIMTVTYHTIELIKIGWGTDE